MREAKTHRQCPCLAVALTLHLLLLPTYVGTVFAVTFPSITLPLLFCLCGVFGFCRTVGRAVSRFTACARPKRRRLPREQRLLAKKTAKARRSELFHYGRRWVFWREFGIRCIALLRAFAFLSVAYAMMLCACWLLSFVYHILVFFQNAVALTFFVCALYSHLFLCCLLLHIPLFQRGFSALREHFQDFVLLVVLWSADSFRGCLLLSFWLLDVHFTRPLHCEYWSILAYVFATTTWDSTFSSIYCFALLGFFLPAFLSKKPLLDCCSRILEWKGACNRKPTRQLCRQQMQPYRFFASCPRSRKRNGPWRSLIQFGTSSYSTSETAILLAAPTWI